MKDELEEHATRTAQGIVDKLDELADKSMNSAVKALSSLPAEMTDWPKPDAPLDLSDLKEMARAGLIKLAPGKEIK